MASISSNLVAIASHTFSESVRALDMALGTESDDYALQIPCRKPSFMHNFYIRFTHLLERMYAFDVSFATLFALQCAHDYLTD
jgi:hypothetical protein